MIIIILLGLVTLALAEPPVGDGYNNVGARQYLPPDFAEQSSRILKSPFTDQPYQYPVYSNEIPRDYGQPSVRGTITQEYGVPTVRAIPQEHTVPDKTASEYTAASARFSDDYSGIITDVPQTYGAPTSKDSSSVYNALNMRSITQYSAPDLLTSSEQYAAPQPNFNNRRTPTVRKYGLPISRNRPYTATEGSRPKSTDGVISYDQKTLSNFHGARNSPEQTYDAPISARRNQNERAVNGISHPHEGYSLSGNYENSGKRISKQYGTPEERNSDFQSNGFLISGRSSFHGYGGAETRTASPSQLYGTPDGGYSYPSYSNARSALEDLLNQEPASYEFGYKVNDYESGSDFGHTENRRSGRAEGSYFVVLPDGTKQVVEYEADEHGFKPRISVEAAHTEGPY